MPIILHIQSVLDKAHVGISESGKMIAGLENLQSRDHAAFIQPAIQNLLKGAGISIQDLDAVAAVDGPGSYTGIRVGLSAAKGLCFALEIPLITLHTLDWMARAGMDSMEDLLCPMIDARRMEVFTAVYEKNGLAVKPAAAVILEKEFLEDELANHRILFFGGGAAKFKSLTAHPNAVFSDLESGHKELSEISWNLYQQRVFTDLYQGIPAYGKEFYSPSHKP